MSATGRTGPGPEGGEGAAGHRLVAHTADVLLEAWGPDRATGLAQAVHGLCASFVDTAGRRPTDVRELRLAPDRERATGDDRAVVMAVLEEVIFLLDAEGVVPVEVTVDDGPDGLRCRFGVIPIDQAEPVGSAPKAITRHGLTAGPEPEAPEWSCRAVVDV